MRGLFALFALVAAASALECYTCDSFLSCVSPTLVHCPPSTQCTWIEEPGTKRVLYRGCTHSCFSLSFVGNNDCRQCRENGCNHYTGGVVPHGRTDISGHDDGNFHNKRSIGGGAYPGSNNGMSNPYGNQNGGNGGYGVYGQNQGLGSGAQPHHNKHHHKDHKIGHGVSAGGQWGIGTGARPTTSTVSSLVAVPIAITVARIFA